MHQQDFFFQAVIYLAAAVISVPIAKKLGLGSVLGYLLAGILIGPYVLKLVGAEGSDVMHFAEFGVVMMLFLIGLELKPSVLWKLRKSIFGLGTLQMVMTALLIGGIAMALGMNFPQSVTIGLILALSSTAIVLQSLAEKGMLKNQAGQTSFSVLLFQDIAVIPILAILPLMANQVQLSSLEAKHVTESHESLVAGLQGWQQLLLILAVVAGIIIIGKFLARYIFRFIAGSKLREIFTAAALLMVVAIAVAMNQVGLSPALGTFLAGVVLADNEYRHELETDIEPFKGLLLGLFFIAVGASINFSLLFEKPLIILAALVTLVIVKLLVLLFLGRLFGLKSGNEMLFAFALAQTGEFAFVLLSFSGQNAILDPETNGILLIVVALSMLITPLLLIVNDKLVQPLMIRKENEQEADEIDEQDNPVIIAGFGRFGVVVGRFLKANGIRATILDNNPENIQVLRKFGFKVFYGDASRHDLLRTAGAASAKVIVLAMDDQEKITGIAQHIKSTYPNLKILSRSVDIRHSFELEDIKVNGQRRETYDSSLALGAMALHELGFGKYQSHRLARSFMHHDFAIMKELHKLWKEDSGRYVMEARKFSEQLENILLAEQNVSIHESDSAWDATTLREEMREIYGRLIEDQKD
jgi:glutathione-regulated potassium-efflux system ancillary protein KefC